MDKAVAFISEDSTANRLKPKTLVEDMGAMI